MLVFNFLVSVLIFIVVLGCTFQLSLSSKQLSPNAEKYRASKPSLNDDEFKRRHTVNELINHKFDATDLRIAGYGINDLEGDTRFRTSFCGGDTCTPWHFQAAGYQEDVLKKHFNHNMLLLSPEAYRQAKKLDSLGSLIKRSSNGELNNRFNFNIGELITTYNFKSSDFKVVGFAISELISDSKFKSSFCGGGIVYKGHCTPKHFLDSGFEVFHFKGIFSIDEIRRTCEVTNKELRDAGFSCAELHPSFDCKKNSDHFMVELRDLGCSASELRDMHCPIKNLKAAFYLKSLKGLFPVSDLRNYFDTPDFKKSGYKVHELLALGDSVFSYVDLRNGGFTLHDIYLSRKELEDASKSVLLGDLKRAGYDMVCGDVNKSEYELNKYDITMLREAKCSVRELIQDGKFLLSSLKDLRYEFKELAANNMFGYSQLRDAGFSPELKDLRDSGYTLKYILDLNLKPRNDIKFLKDLAKLNFTSKDFKDEGYSADDLYRVPSVFTVEKLKSAYELNDLIRVVKSEDLDGVDREKKVYHVAPGVIKLDNKHSTGGVKYQTKMHIKDIYDRFIDLGEFETIESANEAFENEVVANQIQKLKDAGFGVLELKNHFELKHLGMTKLNDNSPRFFSANELHASGFSLADLELQDRSAKDLKNMDFTLKQLVSLDFSITDLIGNAGYKVEDFKKTGTTADKFEKAGFSVEKLRSAYHFKDYDLVELGFSKTQLGYNDLSITSIIKKGDNKFTIKQLNEKFSFTLQQIRKAEVFAKEDFIISGYKGESLKQAGYTIEELKNLKDDFLANYGYSSLLVFLKECGFLVSDLRKVGGFSNRELFAEGYTLSQIFGSNVLCKELRSHGFTFLQMKNASCTMKDLYDSGCILPACLKEAKFSLAQIREFRGVPPNNQGFSVDDLRSCYDIPELFDEGYSLSELGLSDDPEELFGLKFSLSQMRKAKIPLSIIKKYVRISYNESGLFTLKEVIEAGYEKDELRAAGFNFLYFKGLKGEGFSSLELVEKRLFTVYELFQEGVALDELRIEKNATVLKTKYGFDINSLYFMDREKNKGFSPREISDACRCYPREIIANITQNQAETIKWMLRSGDFNLKDLKNDGVAADLVMAAGVTVKELFDVGYNATVLKLFNFNNFEDLKKLGFSLANIVDIHKNNDMLSTLKNIHKCSCFNVEDIFGLNVFSLSDFVEAGFPICEIKLAKEGDIKRGLFDIRKFKDVALVRDLKDAKDTNGAKCFTVKEMIDMGISHFQLFRDGTALSDLGLDPASLDLKRRGFSVRALKDLNDAGSVALLFGYNVTMWSNSVAGNTIDLHVDPVIQRSIVSYATPSKEDSKEKTVFIFSANFTKALKLNGDVNSIAVIGNGAEIVSGSSDGSIKIWDSLSGECTRSYSSLHRISRLYKANYTMRELSGPNLYTFIDIHNAIDPKPSIVEYVESGFRGELLKMIFAEQNQKIFNKHELYLCCFTVEELQLEHADVSILKKEGFSLAELRMMPQFALKDFLDCDDCNFLLEELKLAFPDYRTWKACFNNNIAHLRDKYKFSVFDFTEKMDVSFLELYNYGGYSFEDLGFVKRDEATLVKYHLETIHALIHTHKFNASILREEGFSIDDLATEFDIIDLYQAGFEWHEIRQARLILSFKGHTGAVRSVSLSFDGSKIVSGSDDKSIKIWNSKYEDDALYTLTGHASAILSVSFSMDGSKIVSGSLDNSIKIWDATSKVLHTLREHNDAVAAVSFSVDESKIVSGSLDKSIKVWDVKTGTVLQTFTGHIGGVVSVRFSIDGSKVVSGSLDNHIKIWDVETGALLQTYTGHEGAVRAVSFSMDGSKIVSGSEDNSVKIWDINLSTALHTLREHNGDVISVSFSIDGSKIVSGSLDNTIKIWDIKTGALLQTYTGHAGDVISVSFALDGSKIVSGSLDNRIVLKASAFTLDDFISIYKNSIINISQLLEPNMFSPVELYDRGISLKNLELDRNVLTLRNKCFNLTHLKREKFTISEIHGGFDGLFDLESPNRRKSKCPKLFNELDEAPLKSLCNLFTLSEIHQYVFDDNTKYSDNLKISCEQDFQQFDAAEVGLSGSISGMNIWREDCVNSKRIKLSHLKTSCYDQSNPALNATNFINLKVSLTDLKSAGFSKDDLHGKSASLKDLYDAGFGFLELGLHSKSVSELRSEGFDLKFFRDNHLFETNGANGRKFSVKELKASGVFSIKELRNFFDARVVIEVLDGEMNDAISNEVLRSKLKKELSDNFKLTEFKELGKDLSYLRELGFKLSDFLKVDYSISDLKAHFKGCKEYKDSGCPANKLLSRRDSVTNKPLDFTYLELYKCGYTFSDLGINEVGVKDLIRNPYSFLDLESKAEVNVVGAPLAENEGVALLRKATFQDKEGKTISRFNFKSFVDAGFRAEELKKLGFGRSDFMPGEVDCSKMKAIGYSLKDLTMYSVTLCRNSFNLIDFKTAGVSLRSLMAKIYEDNSTEEKRLFNVSSLQSVGYSAKELRNEGATDDEFKMLNNISFLLEDNAFSKHELWSSGLYLFNNTELGFVKTPADKLVAQHGFTLRELLSLSKFDRFCEENVNYTCEELLNKSSNLEVTFSSLSSQGPNAWCTQRIFTCEELLKIDQVAFATLLKMGFDTRTCISKTVDDSLGDESLTFRDAKEYGFSPADLRSSKKAAAKCNSGFFSFIKRLLKKIFFFIDFLFENETCTNKQLKQMAGFVASDFKGDVESGHIDAAEFGALGFDTILDARDAGFDLTALINDFKFPISKLIKGNNPFTLSDFKRQGVDLNRLRLSKVWKDEDFANVGYSMMEMKNGGFSIAQMKSLYGYSPLESYLKDGVWTLSELRTAGFLCKNLLHAKKNLEPIFNYSELKTAGFTPNELLNCDRQNGYFQERQLRQMGFSFAQLGYPNIKNNLTALGKMKREGHDIRDIYEQLKFEMSVDESHCDYEDTFTRLCDTVGCTVCKIPEVINQLHLGHYSYEEIASLPTSKVSLVHFFRANFSLDELKVTKISLASLKKLHFDIEDIHTLPLQVRSRFKCEDYSAVYEGIATADYLKSTFKWTLRELNECYKLDELFPLYEGNIKELLEFYTIGELKKKGVTAERFLESKCTVRDLHKFFSSRDLFKAKVPISELRDIEGSLFALYEQGFTLKELLDIDKFKKEDYEREKMTLDILIDSKDNKNKPLFSLQKLLDLKYSCGDIYIRHKAHNLYKDKSSKDIRQGEELFFSSNCPISELREKDITANELFKLGFSYYQIYEADYSLSPFWTNDENKMDHEMIVKLKQGGFSKVEYFKGLLSIDSLHLLKEAGFELKSFIDAGYSLTELKTFFTIEECKKYGFNVRHFVEASYTIDELMLNEVFSIADLIKGPRVQEGDSVDFNFRKKKWIPGKIMRDRGDGSYDIEYSASDAGKDDADVEMKVESQISDSVDMIRPRGISKLRGVKLSEITHKISIEELVVKSAVDCYHDKTFKCPIVKLSDFRDNNYELKQLLELLQIKSDKNRPFYSLKDFESANYTVLELRSAGVTLAQFKEVYSLCDLYKKGLSLDFLELAGADVRRFRKQDAKFELPDLKMFYKEIGFTLEQLRESFGRIDDFRAADFSLSELKETGFSLKEIKSSKPMIKTNALLKEIKETGVYTLTELCASKLFQGSDISQHYPNAAERRAAKCN